VSGAAARLAASRCRSCGLVAVPAERYGCERCGALPADHDPLALPATGEVSAFAAVHRHHQPEPPTPFVGAAVARDGGPSLKGVVVGGGDAPLRVGERVEGCFLADGAFRWVRR
jgi:uncharacterized OB-fold protein